METAEEERDGEGLEFERVLFSGATFAWSSSKLLLVPDSIFVSIKSHVSSCDSGKT